MILAQIKLKLVYDEIMEPTSIVMMKNSKELGISYVFNAFDNPRDNVESEKLSLTIKNEII